MSTSDGERRWDSLETVWRENTRGKTEVVWHARRKDDGVARNEETGKDKMDFLRFTHDVDSPSAHARVVNQEKHQSQKIDRHCYMRQSL